MKPIELEIKSEVLCMNMVLIKRTNGQMLSNKIWGMIEEMKRMSKLTKEQLKEVHETSKI